MWRHENPTAAVALANQTIAVGLASGRVFVGRADASALDVAREGLDDGVVFMVRVGDE